MNEDSIPIGLCQCGCGQTTGIYIAGPPERHGTPRPWLQGHWHRKQDRNDDPPNPTGLCQCGCGEPTGFYKGGRDRGKEKRWIDGHAFRGPRADYAPPNPSGLCACGCGEETKIAPMTSSRSGAVKGEHFRFLYGHNGRSRPDHPARGGVRSKPWGPHMWSVEDRGFSSPCWIWKLGQDGSGYGFRRYEGRGTVAHRVAWLIAGREIPEGLQLDHLCRQRACVNPDHLEAVTPAENVRRGMRSKLTADDVRSIRAAGLTDETKRSIARRFGVTDASVRSILLRHTWSDVPD